MPGCAIGAVAFGAVPRASGVAVIVGLLPVRALAQILQQGYTPAEHASLTDLYALLAWTAVGCALAAWRFRWH